MNHEYNNNLQDELQEIIAPPQPENDEDMKIVSAGQLPNSEPVPEAGQGVSEDTIKAAEQTQNYYNNLCSMQEQANSYDASGQYQPSYSPQPQQGYYGYHTQGSGYYGNSLYQDYFNQAYSAQTPPPKKKKKGRILKKAGAILASAAVFGIIASGTFLGTNELYYYFNPSARENISINQNSDGNKLNLDSVTNMNNKIPTTTVSENTKIVSSDVSEVVASAKPSIVAITSNFTMNSWYGPQETQGGGSGIIVGENETELLIATNNHVVENADSIIVTLNDGSEYNAIIKGRDSVADLAVIAIKLKDMTAESKSAIRIATLGDSGKAMEGQMAIAIGNALGYGQSTTVGYISAIDREVNVDGTTMVLLQTDAAINPGNSGGALLNINGEVIGINTVKYATNEVEGMGFAIPINKATEILDELMTRETLSEEEKGYLGIGLSRQDITADIAAAYNWPMGVYVASITAGGAAEKAGLQPGDIITGVNGTTVTTRAQLKEKVNSYRAGTTITIIYQRMVDGVYQEMELSLTLGENPELANTKPADEETAPKKGIESLD